VIRKLGKEEGKGKTGYEAVTGTCFLALDFSERGGEDQLGDRVRNEEVLHKVMEEGNILQTTKISKANWTGHILRMNCLLKHVIEGKIEGRIEVTERRGRRREKLLADLKERRGHWKLKEEALGRTLWRTRF
jgi:hypothetical protein